MSACIRLAHQKRDATVADEKSRAEIAELQSQLTHERESYGMLSNMFEQVRESGARPHAHAGRLSTRAGVTRPRRWGGLRIPTLFTPVGAGNAR
eukprot:5092539-Prymnesium_polylepis.1